MHLFARSEIGDGFRRLKFFIDVPLQFPSGFSLERDATDSGTWCKIDLLEIDGDNRGTEGRLEVIDLASVIEYGAPISGCKIRMIGIDRTPRNRDVSHHTEDSRNLLASLIGIRQLGEIIGSANETILRGMRTWQEFASILPRPVAVERQLLIVGGAVGHDLVLATMVNDEFAIEVFEDRGVAAWVTQ